jgi:hypothetical protein
MRMPQSARRRDRLVGLFAAGLVLFNPPVIDLFSGGALFGWPSLYVYIFGAWACIIVGLAVVIERGSVPLRNDSRMPPR